jgi:large subunit ribosomal protein L10
VALTLEQKKQVVAEVANVAQRAQSAVAAQYRGMTVAEMTKLRVLARNGNVYLRVVPNNLARRAVEGTHFSCMQEGFSGPLVLAFSEKEPNSAAQVMGDFAKENDKLVVTMVAFGGKLHDPVELSVLAKMPTREGALSILLALLKTPVTQLVRTLAEPHARLVRTLAAIRDQKQSATQ